MEKRRYVLCVSSGEDTCCHVGIIDHSWFCCWYFTSLDQYIMGSRQEMKLNMDLSFVQKENLDLGVLLLGSYPSSFAHSVRWWGKLLHSTVSQFPLLWIEEMIAYESKYWGWSFKEVMRVKLLVQQKIIIPIIISEIILFHIVIYTTSNLHINIKSL